MRKVLTAVATLALLTGVLTLPASANSAPATIDLTVNEVATVTFSDASASFGAVNPGVTQEQLSTFQYTLATNRSAGASITIDVAADSGAGVTYSLRYNSTSHVDETSATNENYQTIPAGATSAWKQWRNITAVSAGSTVYKDDVQIVVGATASAGAKSKTLTYVAAVN